MYNFDLKDLRQRFNMIKSKEENEGSDYEEDVYELERNIDDEIESLESFTGEHPRKEEQVELKGLKQLKIELNQFKKENDFYDEEAELDRMFPNRHDDDFDDDSMSYDSVFGDD